MKENKEVVLIGVLKDKRDLSLLLKKKQYRIPVLSMPRRKAGYIAFYQPSALGRSGRMIRRYARIINCEIAKRKFIIPGEPDHPRADDDYCLLSLDDICELQVPIRNRSRTRVTFGFTTLAKMLKARTVLELFDVPPIEDLVAKALAEGGIKASKEHTFSLPGRKKYRLDFAVFCRKGLLDIECDGEKWHLRKMQAKKDTERDRALKNEGWAILRLKESEIVRNMDKCMGKIGRKIKSLGGLLKKSR
ncbi:hypothetical protein COY52_01735 [Candidatus Desantisbacteria bacterium CG_4_10_14_0_8_um_filter_48_22]|uniref:Restriction endonuclease type II-like domain-containing protein n=1 Tax=Candidatus Desantisbacteria bacterium CG_4_10_14_0_8_um_filter_48_22 TaxID=1974543 RepID=A0A2M7SEU4_9BACT|nr:MAG: hypothetical protein COY52_01735 [Candidatus Desantisbacteria bacterium CG_4_10_14_0_8_um_filter_48_22]